MVPVPITASGGRLLRRCITVVRISTGLVAITSTASGALRSSCSAISRNTAALRLSRSRRVSPGFWPTPAQITITPQPARSA